MLLPRPPRASEEDGEDPRAELMRRLLEYEQMKLAGQKLNELPQAGRDFEIVQVLIENTVQERLHGVFDQHLHDLEIVQVLIENTVQERLPEVGVEDLR